jgi:glycine hydroxymethyltransferase
MKNNNLTTTDPLISNLINDERLRQEHELNLIASENYTPAAVLQATGSLLTNKYAEGYPGKRYYGGCQFVDQVETAAIERCKQLFGAEHANVQPHSGSQANMGVYMAALKPGDTIMGMSLAAGGHLTHGHNISFSGTFYKTVQYGVNPETELLDYDAIQAMAHEHKPKIIVAGASAYSRTLDFERFATIAQSVNALLLVDMAHIAGLVAAGVHPSPVPYADFVSSTTHKTLRGPRSGFVLCKQQHGAALDKAIMPGIQGGPFMHVIAAKAVGFKLAMEEDFKRDQRQTVTNAQTLAQAFKDLGYRIVSGGTDNHLFMLDLRNQNITGLQAEQILANVGISINRNAIPFDPQKPWITSGIRLGTPALTTRGMKEQEMLLIANLIDEALKTRDDLSKAKNIKAAVQNLCKQFPIYENQEFSLLNAMAQSEHSL